MIPDVALMAGTTNGGTGPGSMTSHLDVVDNSGPGGVVSTTTPGAIQFSLTEPAGVGAAITSASNLGDLNGDGRDDFAVGDISASTNGRNSNGAVWVAYSPASGDLNVRSVDADGAGL